MLDRDVDVVIATHARDRAVPRWLHETAEALAEIDRPDLAIDWAEQATDHSDGHQSLQAAEYDVAGSAWPPYRDHVLDRLASRPRDAVLFALLTLQEPVLAWDLAHEFHLNDADAWDQAEG